MRIDRAPTADVVHTCTQHGTHTGEVCIKCYAIQQERVERESLPLRLMETTQAQRAWVMQELAKRNGH